MHITIGLAMAVAAISQATTPTRHPPLQAGKFSFLMGRWSGSGTFAETGAKVESDLEFTAPAGADAIQLNQRERAPNKFVYVGLWSADTSSGGLVMLLAGNNGGGARLLRSDGWRDGCLTFQTGSELRAWFAAERFRFCREATDQLRVSYELSRDGSVWIVGDTQTYTRSATSGPASRSRP